MRSHTGADAVRRGAADLIRTTFTYRIWTLFFKNFGSLRRSALLVMRSAGSIPSPSGGIRRGDR